MNNIKVGEFIRTKEGTIEKIKRIDFDEIDKSLKWYIYDKKDYTTGIVGERAINKPYIKSHSFNIAEILEEDDYVNGNKVVKQVSEEDKEPYLVVVVSSKMIKEPLFDYITNNRIKSIVTKEQFKAMEYEVK